MNELTSTDLVGFIKERQYKQSENISQHLNRNLKLVIIQAIDDPVINKFVSLKKKYGLEIGIDVESTETESEAVEESIKKANEDDSVDGVIVQLPIKDIDDPSNLLNTIDPAKDVDGLGVNSTFSSASATAVIWLLAAHNIKLEDKNILIIGQGRLVGAPLSKILKSSNLEFKTADIDTKNLNELVTSANLIISAVGKKDLVKSSDIQKGSIVIDAGSSSENGQIFGDVEEEARQRSDIQITPVKGGLGPLTIAVLFENVISSSSS